KERITEFRKNDKVIYLCDAHADDDKEFKDWPPHAIKGSWGAQVVDEIAPQPEDTVVEKKTYDGFIKTELESILEKENVSEIYVVGVLTNICVLYTSAHAKMLGYPVTVYRKGCASITPEKHEWALKEMSESLKIEVL
ncbi:MAG: cysteine hydrolase, partial [Synergistetes bacterium]|nr:cysteine hydrolase [Synergistota bacterium]